MLPAAFVALAALTLSAAPPNRRRPRSTRTAIRLSAAADPNALYSQRARRRMAMYLKLRLLELRELHLERAAAAIERRLPVSELLKGP